MHDISRYPVINQMQAQQRVVNKNCFLADWISVSSVFFFISDSSGISSYRQNMNSYNLNNNHTDINQATIKDLKTLNIPFIPVFSTSEVWINDLIFRNRT